METTDAVNVLGALAQESRLKVFRLLVQAGQDGLSAGKISDTTGVPPSSLSFHLKELSYAGLVNARNESRFVIYTANFSTMTELLAFLTENCCEGDPCTPFCTPASFTESIVSPIISNSKKHHEQ